MAKLLSREKQDIILIDDNEERMSTLSSNFDLMTVNASPTSIKGLKEVGAGEADLFIAVTPDESRNITACMLATNLGAVKTVGRIDNYEYLLPKNKEFFPEVRSRFAYIPGNACGKRDCIFHPYELGTPMVGILRGRIDSDRRQDARKSRNPEHPPASVGRTGIALSCGGHQAR